MGDKSKQRPEETGKTLEKRPEEEGKSREKETKETEQEGESTGCEILQKPTPE